MGRTLIIERHDWETGAASHQLQIPSAAFAAFFGRRVGRRFNRTVRIFNNPTSSTPSNQVVGLFRSYKKSATNRINCVMELGNLNHAVVLIEEIKLGNRIAYDLWWFSDPHATSFLNNGWNWQQARGSQYGSGRRWIILSGSGPRS